VFAIGLEATFADATFLFRRPGHLLRALLSMNVLMPLTALAVGAPFDLHPAVTIALVVISVSPAPPILPKKALKAGGTEAYTSGCWSALSIVVIQARGRGGLFVSDPQRHYLSWVKVQRRERTS
jgi:BASS family bile acid:Na+ symporter